MHRIDGPGATVDNHFTEGDPTNAVPATVVTDDWLNDVQENVCNVIETAGIPLVKGTANQLRLAIAQMISSSSLDLLNTTRIDVASAGTVNLTAAAPNTRHINITGTTTISGFTVAVGRCYFVRFAGALTLTNGAGLVTQTGANIAVQPGDTCIIRATAANVVEVLCYSTVKVPVQGAPITLTGTAVDVTAIPSWVKKITIIVANMSGSGTSPHVLQIGTSGGIETTNYLGGVSSQGAGGSSSNFTIGFKLEDSVAAASINHGIITLINLGGNLWVEGGNIAKSDTTLGSSSAGSKQLGGVLDRFRLTATNGTDTFDGGTFSVIYEG